MFRLFQIYERTEIIWTECFNDIVFVTYSLSNEKKSENRTAVTLSLNRLSYETPTDGYKVFKAGALCHTIPFIKPHTQKKIERLEP